MSDVSTKTAGASTLDVARHYLRSNLQTMLSGNVSDPVRREALYSGERVDDGVFGPNSVTWRVHTDASMLIGGLRALMLQTMHPLAMAGIDQHSAYRDDPFGRLQRTGNYVGTVTFGTTAEVDAAITGVRRAHGRVTGVARDGREYSANDPHLLAWVHHTLVDSFLRSYQRYATTPLDCADADRYVDEQSELARRIGAVSPAPAQSVAELRAWLMTIRPELRSTSEARDAVRFLVFFRGSALIAAPYAVVSAASVGLLPRFVRRALWLPTLPFADRFVVQPAATATTRALGWVLQPD